MGFAIAMMAVGTGMQALSTYRQGQYASAQAKAQAQVSDYDAQVADVNAEAVKQKSLFDQLRALRAGGRRVGALRGKLATGGAVLSEGAPADVIAEEEFENALNVGMIGYEGVVEAGKLRRQAGIHRFEAVTHLAAAKQAKRAGTIGAISQVVGGLGSMYLMSGLGSPKTPALQGSNLGIKTRFETGLRGSGRPVPIKLWSER